jgi:hypothetical protein
MSFSCFFKAARFVVVVVIVVVGFCFFFPLGQNYLHNHPAGASAVKGVQNKLLVL